MISTDTPFRHINGHIIDTVDLTTDTSFFMKKKLREKYNDGNYIYYISDNKFYI